MSMEDFNPKRIFGPAGRKAERIFREYFKIDPQTGVTDIYADTVLETTPRHVITEVLQPQEQTLPKPALAAPSSELLTIRKRIEWLDRAVTSDIFITGAASLTGILEFLMWNMSAKAHDDPGKILIEAAGSVVGMGIAIAGTGLVLRRKREIYQLQNRRLDIAFNNCIVRCATPQTPPHLALPPAQA